MAYGNREMHVHPDRRRRVSVHEAAMLQGFPPGYEFLGGFCSAVEQVCNAVPPPLARVVGGLAARSFVGEA